MITPVMPTYARAPVSFVKGEGPWLIDENGERYLDFASGIAVNALGHAHPALVEALTEQARRLWHVSNLFEIPGQRDYAAKLVDNTFADTVFFANSGAEANECAIKMARKFHSHHGRPERWRIVAFEGSFHGRTLATIAAAGAEKLVKGFGPMPDGFDHVPFADHDALRAAIGPETAAIMLEPIMGEGGIRTIPAQCLQGLRALCDEAGILLILDEIQTGMGRTGKLFAHEWSGVAPDVMSIAKGAGGGFPMGACLATEAAAVGMTAGSHGTTFGGNPLAMAVGNAVIDAVLADGFLDRVQAAAGRLRQRLEGLMAAHPQVIEAVRGEGLLMGLKLKTPNADFIAAARDQRLLLPPAGDNVVRVIPPLIVDDAAIDAAVAALDATCQAVGRGGEQAA